MAHRGIPLPPSSGSRTRLDGVGGGAHSPYDRLGLAGGNPTAFDPRDRSGGVSSSMVTHDKVDALFERFVQSRNVERSTPVLYWNGETSRWEARVCTLLADSSRLELHMPAPAPTLSRSASMGLPPSRDTAGGEAAAAAVGRGECVGSISVGDIASVSITAGDVAGVDAARGAVVGPHEFSVRFTISTPRTPLAAEAPLGAGQDSTRGGALTSKSRAANSRAVNSWGGGDWENDPKVPTHTPMPAAAVSTPGSSPDTSPSPDTGGIDTSCCGGEATANVSQQWRLRVATRSDVSDWGFALHKAIRGFISRQLKREPGSSPALHTPSPKLTTPRTVASGTSTASSSHRGGGGGRGVLTATFTTTTTVTTVVSASMPHSGGFMELRTRATHTSLGFPASHTHLEDVLDEPEPDDASTATSTGDDESTSDDESLHVGGRGGRVAAAAAQQQQQQRRRNHHNHDDASESSASSGSPRGIVPDDDDIIGALEPSQASHRSTGALGSSLGLGSSMPRSPSTHIQPTSTTATSTATATAASTVSTVSTGAMRPILGGEEKATPLPPTLAPSISHTVSTESSTSSGGWRPRFMRKANSAMSEHSGVAYSEEDAPPLAAATRASGPPHWYATCSEQGHRPHMEDVHVEIPNASALLEGVGGGAATGYFAVFDGHCGRYAAEFTSARLHKYIFGHAAYGVNDAEAVSSAFARVDEEFLSQVDAAPPPRPRPLNSGCTALAVLLREDTLLVANLGDCRAVICRSGGVAVQLSVEHTPTSELSRIVAAGGWVTKSSEMNIARVTDSRITHPFVHARMAADPVRMSEISRVCGELGVSRAFGDADYKGHRMAAFDWYWPDDRVRTFRADLIVSEPDITRHDIAASDAFVLLSCDGLWEVLTPQEAIDLLVDHFSKGMSVQQAAQSLVNIALQLGSSDNITAMVIILRHTAAGAKLLAGMPPS